MHESLSPHLLYNTTIRVSANNHVQDVCFCQLLKSMTEIQQQIKYNMSDQIQYCSSFSG